MYLLNRVGGIVAEGEIAEYGATISFSHNVKSNEVCCIYVKVIVKSVSAELFKVDFSMFKNRPILFFM